MPVFASGTIVTMRRGETSRVYEVIREGSGGCPCHSCREYVVECCDTRERIVVHNEDLVPFDGNRARSAPSPSVQVPLIGQAYRVIDGPARGYVLCVSAIYVGGMPGMATGALYNEHGARVRPSYEVQVNHLGERCMLPLNMLPPQLRMPGSGDMRWNNVATGVRQTCTCARCSGHTCTQVCDGYSGCPHPHPSECMLLQRMPWNYREPLTFWGDGPLFLGCELELQTRQRSRSNAAIQIVNDHIADKVMIKGDGSIEEDGIELAMHPMDYMWMREHFPAQPMFRELRDLGVRPHRSCGMHVHLSRAGFSGTKHSYIWQKLFYRNIPEMTTLSRRDPDRLDRWATFGDRYHRTWSRHFAKGAMGGQRYVALNMNNAETVELRIFASTLSPQAFWGSLALADATVEYTRELDTQKIIKDKAWGFSAFKSYVSGIDKYKPLKREIVRLGL